MSYIPSLELPENAFPTACLLIVTYLDEDGNQMYAVGTKGEALSTHYLGMTVRAQAEILSWT